MPGRSEHCGPCHEERRITGRERFGKGEIDQMVVA
jgi:hypothetical protein